MCEEDFKDPPPLTEAKHKKETTIKHRKTKNTKKKVLYVNLQHTHYDIVHKVFADMGWVETDDDIKCTLMWHDCGGSSEVCSSLLPWQFYNHFQAIWSIARKVELLRNYKNMNNILPDVYNFHPKSFLLPGQYAGLKTYMNSYSEESEKGKVTFIIKPDRGAQGRGIFLVQDPEQCEKYSEMAVAQQYISPYLIDGYKFDLRLYVLITAVSPLRIYFHNEGMARFCTEKYVKPQQGNLSKVFGHLTNYSLNKKNAHFQKNTDASDATKGSKRSYSFVLDKIKEDGGDIELLQKKIDRILRLTIASIHPRLENNYKATVSVTDDKCRCFEILGFDILLDDKLDPWLIEVNNMPSLSCDSPFDRSLKESVVKGALTILNIQPGFKKIVNDEERAVTQMRISGSTNLQRFNIFDADKETEISKETNWRMIYPIVDDEKETEIMEKALATAKSLPTIGPITTKTQKARMKGKDKEDENKQKPRKKVNDKRGDKNAPSKHLFYEPYSRKGKLNPSRIHKTIPSKKPDTLFGAMKGNEIKVDEERERMITMREQTIESQTANLLKSIKIMLDCNDGKSNQKAITPLKSPIKITKTSKIIHPISKPKLPIATVLIGEGYRGLPYSKKINCFV